MKALRVGAFFIILAIATAVIIFWKPWSKCDAPKEVCQLVSTLDKHEGVLDSRVTSKELDQDPFAKPELAVEFEFEISDQLDPTESAAVALDIAQQLQAEAHRHNIRSHELTFVAGPPQKHQNPKFEVYPLKVSEEFSDFSDEERLKPSELSEKTSFAFNLRQLGATKVENYSATANSQEQLLTLGRYAAQHNRPTHLLLEDQTLSYTSDKHIDFSEIEFLVEAAQRNGLNDVSIDNSGLTLHLAKDTDSDLLKTTLSWLNHHEPFAEPMAYTVVPHDYANIAEGWVGTKLPDWLIPKPMQLPADESAWPKDQSAPLCEAENLELTLGPPDAASGSRYMSVFAKNISSSSCAVESYPHIDFLNGDGEAQPDVNLQPEPSIALERIVIPVGKTALSTLDWNAMSTSLDPDETVALSIAATKGMKKVKLVPEYEGQKATLDILDGAEVTQSPWVQARNGWALPDEAVKQGQPNSPRP
ncbi:hypothetical protein AQ436_17135 [Arthrobacter sp. EpRS66]|nr:hypothetical protein AQ436_17135 [Arthrobacter sp. EpRS66]